MRVKNDIGDESTKQKDFAYFLLDLREDRIFQMFQKKEFAFEINESLALKDEDLSYNIDNHQWLRKLVILISTNVEVDMVNE